MEMCWRSSRPGRAARQIVCRCPTPQPGQRSSTITAAGGTAGDEANEAASPNATMSETKTTSTEIPIGDGDGHLGSTRDDTGPAAIVARLPNLEMLVPRLWHLETDQARHHRLGQTGGMRRQGRLGESSPGHATAIGAEDSHWQGYLLSPDSHLARAKVPDQSF